MEKYCDHEMVSLPFVLHFIIMMLFALA